MTANHRPYLADWRDRKPALRIGPRVEHEINRRIAELKARHPSAMSHGDKRELNKLVTFLALLRTGGDIDA